MTRRARPRRPTPTASTHLAELVALRARFGEEAAARKRVLLAALAHSRLPDAEAVLRLHETLLFLRVYPDDDDVLGLTERLLGDFARRRDLRRHRAELADSGIAGTEIRYPFFFPTARWLAERHPERLRVDWPDWEDARRLEPLLPQLVPYAESPLVDELSLTPRQWLARLKGPEEGDGAFLARRFAALAADPMVREALYDQLSPPMRLAGGEGGPSRTTARAPRRAGRSSAVVHQRGPLDVARPDLRSLVPRLRLAVHDVEPRRAERFLDLAREAMVTRSRDLDAFANADRRDVRVIECDDGLSFVCLGALPERRLMLESSYGLLTVRNDVPIGYVLISSLFRSGEIAYNVFETFRGGEAARILARVLAVAYRVFGARTFSIDPYQLGHFGNEEGLASGAWWFYNKLGFRPRDAEVRKLERRELGALRRNAAHRSDRETLDALSAAHVYLSLGRHDAPALGGLPLARLGAATSRLLASRYGGERERGLDDCERELADLLGVRSRAGWSAGERLWWRRWSPFLLTFPAIARWPLADRRALVDVVRAKGGRRESDFVHRFDAHARLRAAVYRRLTAPAAEE